jgi:hypothetical protein
LKGVFSFAGQFRGEIDFLFHVNPSFSPFLLTVF